MSVAICGEIIKAKGESDRYGESVVSLKPQSSKHNPPPQKTQLLPLKRSIYLHAHAAGKHFNA